ncbi:MAG: OmpH family outer membrane protein [Rhodocyclaceae bacterium]|nr:OmpH family outer membrane protein [Rhodocyclaceae bacterium]
MKRIGLAVLASVLIGLPVTVCAQAKIGFVNSDRVMREASPAVAAQKRLEKEFEPRDRELQAQGKRLQNLQEDLERNGMTMSPEDRRNSERQFNELNRDFQRSQREFREDLNARRNEELAAVLDRANKVIKEIAERDGFDIIFQEAVYASTRIDITDQVIKALAAGK